MQTPQLQVLGTTIASGCQRWRLSRTTGTGPPVPVPHLLCQGSAQPQRAALRAVPAGWPAWILRLLRVYQVYRPRIMYAGGMQPIMNSHCKALRFAHCPQIFDEFPGCCYSKRATQTAQIVRSDRACGLEFKTTHTTNRSERWREVWADKLAEAAAACDFGSLLRRTGWAPKPDGSFCCPT